MTIVTSVVLGTVALVGVRCSHATLAVLVQVLLPCHAT